MTRIPHKAAARPDPSEAERAQQRHTTPQPGMCDSLNTQQPSGHRVQFYESDTFFLDAIGDFIAAGFASGSACLVFATPAHREQLAQHLQDNRLGLTSAWAEGQCLILDADETLDQFMVDGLPDAQRFAQVVGGLITRAAQSHHRVRVVGEMVALLWQQGQREAAMRLEALWNELSGAQPFMLLCAYPMSLFAGSAQSELFARLCALHSQVIPDERYVGLATQQEQLQALALFQQQALSLAAEQAERQAAEEAKHHLAAIVSSSDDAILSKDLDGIITSWNSGAERLYGYSAQEIVGQPVTIIFPPNRQDEFAQIMEHIRRGERVDHFETTRVCKDGTFLSVSVTVSPVRNHRGVLIGASAIARDISKRKELERQREAFISLITHELKTPLTSLQGNIQLAKRRLTRLLSQIEHLEEGQQRTLEDVLSMLGRSQHPLRVQQRLINDLLDFSHLQEDKMELHLEVCNLVELVAETLQDHQAAHPARLITLSLPEQDPILVYADQDRLQQVLSNYLTNALKFSPATEPVQIGIVLEAEMVRVWVRDHGPGLSMEQQTHIWQQFYQAPNTPIQNGWKTGLGLGLYICQQLIVRQQGEVGVESRPGQGANFWFRLPMPSAAALPPDEFPS